MKVLFTVDSIDNAIPDALSGGLDRTRLEEVLTKEFARYGELIDQVGIPVEPPINMPFLVGVATKDGTNMIVAIEDGWDVECGVQSQDPIDEDMIRLFANAWFVKRVLGKESTHLGGETCKQKRGVK